MTGAIAALLGIVLVAHPALAQQAAPRLDTSRGLMIRFADGRMHTKPLRPRGRVWTANFPRLPGATPTYGKLPLSVLDIQHVDEGADVVVTVSLSYGSASKNQVKVATVRLSSSTPVEVNQLRSYGVEPISLSIVTIPNTPANVPEAVSSSPLLDIRAVQYGPNASSYGVVLTNRSERALMLIRFTGYRDGKAFTGGQAGFRSTPLVAANSEDVFEIALGPTGFIPGNEPHAWSTIDRIEITSLLWQDGTFEGDPKVAVQLAKAAGKRAAELQMLSDVLAAGRGQAAPSLRSRIAVLTIESTDVRESARGLAAQLDTMADSGSTREGLPLDAWVSQAIKFYQDWRNRIVVPRIDR